MGTCVKPIFKRSEGVSWDELEDTVTFVVRYDQPETILNSWSIEWHGKQYDIETDTDTAKKTMDNNHGKPVANK